MAIGMLAAMEAHTGKQSDANEPPPAISSSSIAKC